MKKTIFFEKIKTYCINTIAMQLFLFLLSLPVIVAWGLPISIMTLISTPLFGPALTLFLLLSTLIFICTLCSIPYSLLITLLDITTHAWDRVLSYSFSTWLFAFIRPSFFYMSCWSIVNIFFLLYILELPTKKRLNLLCWYSCVIIILLHTQKYFSDESTYNFFSKSGNLKLFFKKNKTIIIDQSFFARQKSSDSWIQYTLIPTLIKKTGHTNIDTIIFTKLSKNSANALKSMTKQCHINHIILPFFSPLIDKTTQNSVIITSIDQQHALYAHGDFIFHIQYNQKKKKLEVEERYGTKKSSIYHRF